MRWARLIDFDHCSMDQDCRAPSRFWFKLDGRLLAACAHCWWHLVRPRFCNGNGCGDPIVITEHTDDREEALIWELLES